MPPTETSPGTPYNHEAEEALIGAILIAPEQYRVLSAIVRPEDFRIQRFQFVWKAAQELQDKGQPIDFVTLNDQLKRDGKLDEVGDDFLYSMNFAAPNAFNAEGYANIVADFGMKRDLLYAANDIAAWSYNGKSGMEIMTLARKRFEQIETGRGFGGEKVSVRDVLSQIYDEMETGVTPLKYIPSGLRALDDLIDGFAQTKYVVIAGRPGDGKTAFMLDAAREAAVKHRQKVAFFSLEMSAGELTDRMIAQITGIDSKRIEKRKLRDDEWPLFTDAVEQLANSQMDLYYRPGLSIPELRARCLRGKYDMVFVDYLQLMIGENRKENRVQELSFITRNLKVLAGEINAPVISASQMNRGVEGRADKEPQLSDLRESGSIEQDADIVMFIYGAQPTPMPKEPRKFKIAKHRGGPVGTITATFTRQAVHFEG
jgi:replicative DNA helicase